MQALWRVQAHMLARIVVEIRAADIAVELYLYTCTTIWYVPKWYGQVVFETMLYVRTYTCTYTYQ
jgi:hypothetical protein